MRNPLPILRRRTNEELFFDYYPQVLEWVSRLTRFDRTEAEDLIQDFYIQIVNAGQTLAEVQEIRPYLFKILRNLHSSRLRQRAKVPICDLSVLDYDSVELGIRYADWRDLFLIRATLKQICQFACERKNTARSASVFLLRFFLGYFPSEVMKVAQITRVGVDKATQLMRREAQEYLNGSGVLRPGLKHDVRAGESQIAADHAQSLFLELRQTIFNSREGECFRPEMLKRHFSGGVAAQLSVNELAHLVSCKACLDRVNAILGLPLLDDRWPDNATGRDNPPPGSGSPGGSGGGFASPRSSEKKAQARSARSLARGKQAWFEHRPVRLEIAVNGETRASQRITSEISELYLKLNRNDDAEFIEIFSEQGVRMLYLQVHEPSLAPGLEQHSAVVLSDSRSLDVTLSFTSDQPTVLVVYRDPVLAWLASDRLDENLSAASAPVEMKVRHEPDDSQPGPVIKFSTLERLPLSTNWFTWFWTSPAGLVFVVGLVVAAILIVPRLNVQSPRIDANVFLEKAQAQDTSASPDETASSGVILQRLRIRTPQRTTERTLYRDVQRRRRMKSPAEDSHDNKLKASLLVAGVDWNDPLSAATYSNWRTHEANRDDSVRSTSDGLLTLITNVSDDAVISESLTVRARDFHAVGRTIELRNYGTVEIAELNYDVLPWSAANQDWFEPLTHAVATDAPGILSPVRDRIPSPVSISEIDDAELDIRYALHKIGADLGEPINVEIDDRQPKPIAVVGIVASEDRRQEVLAALRNMPHMTTRLQTEEEAATQVMEQAAVTRFEPNIVPRHSPIEADLLKDFGDEAAVEKFSVHVTSSVNTLLSHAWALRHLSDRYGDSDSNGQAQLSNSSRQLLDAMRRDHLRVIRETGVELQTLWRPVLAPIVESQADVPSQRSLFESAQQIQQLTLQLLSGAEDQSTNPNTRKEEVSGQLLAELHGLETLLEEPK